MCICTLLTCAVELAALANNKTSPNVVKKIFRLISVLLIWLQSRNRTGADSGTTQAHTKRCALASRHTTALCPRSGARDVEYIWDWSPVGESSPRSDSRARWRCKVQRSASPLSLEQCLAAEKKLKTRLARCYPARSNSGYNTTWP